MCLINEQGLFGWSDRKILPGSFLKKSPIHPWRVVEREIINDAVEVHCSTKALLRGLGKPERAGVIGFPKRLFFKSSPVESVHLKEF